MVTIVCRVCGEQVEEVEAHAARRHPRECFGGGGGEAPSFEGGIQVNTSFLTC